MGLSRRMFTKEFKLAAVRPEIIWCAWATLAVYRFKTG